MIVFGRGFIGRRLARDLPGATLSDADITDPAQLRAALQGARGGVAINAAGKTGRPNVDWCEVHRDATWRANTMGPLLLAEACADAGVHLVHLGSGCIFYGPSPAPGGWREGDHANPESFYSRSKYAADLVLSRLPGVAIARLRMPIDSAPSPRNLLTKLVGYPTIADVANSVTVVEDLVAVVGRLAELRATGVFHVVNPGMLRHQEILAKYREIVDPSHTCAFVEEGELLARGLVVRPRSNCQLASPRLAELGIRMRPVEEALVAALRGYAAARASAEAAR